MKYTFKQFQAEYPNDDACLDAIMKRKYGNNNCCPTCGVEGKLTRIQGRRAYACKEGCHIYPCVGTPFEHSSTPLTLWFHAMYLMTTTRNGVSAKELERQLGVTYKTAWRIGHELRKLMGGKNNTNPPMSGHVEIDETYVGGKEKNKHASKRTRGTQGAGSNKTKAIVFGALERNGNIKGVVIPNTKRDTLEPIIEENITSGTTISTDELKSYKHIHRLGYTHGTVQHGIEQYVNGIHHVNGVEGFWKHLKGAITSTHVHVSSKHLQKYVNEFSFRYNMRKDPSGMFGQLIASL
jgi:transposase-like protein